jgi:hypothetical protein
MVENNCQNLFSIDTLILNMITTIELFMAFVIYYGY